jgi:hypothetical protein
MASGFSVHRMGSPSLSKLDGFVPLLSGRSGVSAYPGKPIEKESDIPSASYIHACFGKVNLARHAKNNALSIG